jgi:hypothetical protein
MQIQQRSNLYISVALAVAAVLIGSFVVSTNFAQNSASSQTLEVSPPSQEIKADPGETVKIKAKVRNKSAVSLPITVRVEDFTASGEGGQVALTEKGPYAVSTWMTIDPASFTLKSGETREVTGTVRVPVGNAGGRYGSFVFAAGGGSSGPGVAAVSQEVASLFLLRISGPIQEVLSIDSIAAPSFVEFGPVPFSLKFSNKGNVHVRPTGLINVRNVFGKTAADIVFRGDNVFPGASRVQDVSYDSQWLFGPYTVQAVLTYGSKNESLTATTTFFAFPLRVAVAIGLVLGVLYMMRKRLAKAFKALVG